MKRAMVSSLTFVTVSKSLWNHSFKSTVAWLLGCKYGTIASYGQIVSESAPTLKCRTAYSTFTLRNWGIKLASFIWAYPEYVLIFYFNLYVCHWSFTFYWVSQKALSTQFLTTFGFLFQLCKRWFVILWPNKRQKNAKYSMWIFRYWYIVS